MQEIPNFKTANLKQRTYLCILDSKCSFKPSIRARQNLETQKHALANTKKKHHNLVAIFGIFQIEIKFKLNIFRQ
jgi:hypothetical protein